MLIKWIFVQDNDPKDIELTISLWRIMEKGWGSRVACLIFRPQLYSCWKPWADPKKKAVFNPKTVAELWVIL